MFLVLFSYHSVITDLIAEANATKEAIDEAYDGIEKANEVAHAPPPAAPTMDGDLFSWDEPAGPVKDSSPPLPGDSGPLPGDSAPAQLSRDSAVNQQYSVPALTDKARSVQQNEPPPPAPAAEENHQPTFVYQPPAPAPASDSYGHKRDPSLGFGEVMGGSAPDLKGMASEETGGAASHDAYGDAPSIQNVEELKKKAKEAHDVAKDAEDSRQQLVAQLNELRRVADQAEQAARDAANKSAGKKKGPLWRGQKRDAVSVVIPLLSIWVTWLASDHIACFSLWFTEGSRKAVPRSEGKEGRVSSGSGSTQGCGSLRIRYEKGSRSTPQGGRRCGDESSFSSINAVAQPIEWLRSIEQPFSGPILSATTSSANKRFRGGLRFNETALRRWLQFQRDGGRGWFVDSYASRTRRSL
jgi:hypothetical protein